MAQYLIVKLPSREATQQILLFRRMWTILKPKPKSTVDDFLFDQFLPLECVRNIDAKGIVLLHRHQDIFPSQRIGLGNIDDLLQQGLVLAVHPDEDGIFDIDAGLIVFDVVDESLDEVGELWLKDKQTTLFVISPSADGLTHKNPVRCTIQQPEALFGIGVVARHERTETIYIQQLSRCGKSRPNFPHHSIQIYPF